MKKQTKKLSFAFLLIKSKRKNNLLSFSLFLSLFSFPPLHLPFPSLSPSLSITLYSIRDAKVPARRIEEIETRNQKLKSLFLSLSL